MTVSAPARSFGGRIPWRAAWRVPICVSIQVQTDQWDETLMNDAIKTNLWEIRREPSSIMQDEQAEAAKKHREHSGPMIGVKGDIIANKGAGNQTDDLPQAADQGSQHTLYRGESAQTMRILVPPEGMVPPVGMPIPQIFIEKAIEGAQGAAVTGESALPVVTDLESEGGDNLLSLGGGASKQRKAQPKAQLMVVPGFMSAPHEKEKLDKGNEDKQPINASIIESEKLEPGQSASRFGSCIHKEGKKWEVVIWRTPTRMTMQERDFSRKCTQTYPPSTKKYNFHPISAPQMLRCPIGGGSCLGSLINIKTPKAAAFTHFSLHHRDGKMYSIKIEGSHNNFLYTDFPGQMPVQETKSNSSFDEMTQTETAGTIRRRQRLYPRLARGETGGGEGPSVGEALPTIEELLSGSISKCLGRAEGEVSLSGDAIAKKKVIVVDDPTQKESPRKNEE